MSGRVDCEDFLLPSRDFVGDLGLNSDVAEEFSAVASETIERWLAEDSRSGDCIVDLVVGICV
jgi:hypothetical protein